MQSVLSYSIAFGILSLSVERRSTSEEKLTRYFVPVHARKRSQQIVGWTAAIGGYGASPPRLTSIDSLNGFSHPLSHQQRGHEGAPPVLLVRDMDAQQPAFSIRILAQQCRIFHHVRVDVHDFAFGGRNHFGFLAIPVEGGYFLPLANPLPGSWKF